MRLRPSIRTLVLGVNVFVLLVPILAILLLRIYDTHLIQLTERKLIAESVLIGEAWRDRWLEAQGLTPAEAPTTRPPTSRHSTLYPIEPMLDLSKGGLLSSSAPAPTHIVQERDGIEWIAGRSLIPMLERAQRVNLSGARVLNTDGCIVASTGGDVGACIDHLPEVRGALAGNYTAVARQRISDEPPPPLTSMSRRGKVRIFIANPIYSNGEVIGVVRVVRTAMDPLESIWLHRQSLWVALAACLMLTLAFSMLFSHAITRPVRAILGSAQAVARSEEPRPFVPSGIVPEELHELSEALESMTHQLTDRAEYVRDFAGNVVHELKTPLTGIRGATELLRESWQEMESEQRERFLANIDADAAHLQRLASRLLQLARIQNAPQTKETVEVVPLLEELVERYDAEIRLTVNGPPTTLVANPDHFESVVRNLIDNAVRHGNGKPVEVTAAGRDGRLVLTVRDHGAGISEANRDRIFDRFFTTERDHGGTGLGLAIVQAFARTRGGDVTFETGDYGTAFVVTL